MDRETGTATADACPPEEDRFHAVETGAVELSVPPNTSSGRVFRLKGKGLPGKPAAGDLYVAVKIVLPDGKDAELEELMRKWREEKPHDPRKDLG